MKSLKVTHISTVHNAFDIRIFHKECRSLAAFGMEVNLVITHDKEETIDKVRIIPLPHFTNRFARMLIKPFLAFLKALKTKADIFHFHDPELIPIGLLLKLFGKKVIYDSHEDVPSQILDKYWIPKKLRFPISRFFKIFESFAAKFFDGIVTATPHIRSIFLQKNKNTVNINNYPLPEEMVNLEFLTNKREKNEKVISYVGGISKERGILEILKALEGTNIKLHLAGAVSPKGLFQILEKEKGWKNVVYFGHVSRSKACSILSNSHAGICTFHPTAAHIHAVPNKIFEYMNAGIPIIVSRFPCWEDLFKKINNTFFVDPLNPREIREAITSLMEDGEKSASMGKRGLQAVKEIYNWDIEKEKLIKLYYCIAFKLN
ncbi:MAG: glycosyltransferase family 4 protein [Bacteroidota bacterium]|nr:glycosyltransferase family 4 protein [Bacteroidota bacterium]